MEVKFLRKYEGKEVKLVLQNNFIYSYITFRIRDDGLIEFEDRKGNIITIEPRFIALITKINGDDENNK